MAGWTRRKWLSGVAGLMVGGMAAGQKQKIPQRQLGKTGVSVPILAVGGGSAFMAMSDEEAERFLWRALELG